MISKQLSAYLFCLSFLVSGCQQDDGQAKGSNVDASALTAHATVNEDEAIISNATGGPVELDWEELIPSDWHPEKVLDQLYAEDLDEYDPRARELQEQYNAMLRDAPVKESMDGMVVRLPGFIVPLDMDAEQIREFLLVPYFGACIHVPPPPANQTIHVVAGEGNEYPGELFDMVWVTGRMDVARTSSELGEAGYRIHGAKVEEYIEPNE